MDVDGVDTSSPKPVNSISPQVQASSSFGRYSTPVKVPDRSSSGRPNKTLSSIVKVKHKKESGLPVTWRKELYGTSPGSAQARLENLRATLQKEVEEQNNAKATSSVSLKRSHEQISSSKQIATTPVSKRLSNSASITPVAAISAVPETTAVNHTDSVPEVVQQTNTAPVGTVTEQHEDSWEMDVDETNSPEPAVPLSPAIPTSSKGMEYGSLVESKTQATNHATEEVKRDAQKNTDHASNDQDSPKGVSDLKTKYKDGLSAFKDYFYCVIDTNIFIENYNDFQGFLSKKYSGSQPIVVVPYKVLHELDTVKHKKPQLAPKIIPVVKFLHQMLRAKDARVKGQHPWDDMIELMPVHSPDDSIINCALQVQSVADSGNVKVVLVSNDCNMLTKALVANLNSCTMEELQTDFKF
uniref:PIN domain-containing protein n=1 Tax=Anopheles culicifacies TaxID=139723 RepID=A0A182MBC0_9DIPT